MSKALFTEPRFNDDEAARDYLEAITWPNGTICPHCGGTERNSRLQGATHRAGLWFCGDCRDQFTVTVGTVFERSKVPLHKWVLAVHLLCASKKGMSSKQIERMLGVTYKTAWFMTHRIREAMTTEGGMLGGGGKIVEADETFWGTSPRSKKAIAINKSGRQVKIHDKQKVIALVERNGNVRGFHVASINGATLKSVLHGNIAKDSHLMTDDHRGYRAIGRHFISHQAVNHSAGEYSRGNVTTNTIEGYFSILKRGLIGTYHHVAPKHLGRYVTEFDFRYNTRTAMGYTDTERAEIAMRGISGKRLTYRRTEGARGA